MKKTGWLIVLLFFASPLMAANLAVSPNGSGSANGADWDNTLAWGTFTPVRGNTYYLVDGSYSGGKVFTVSPSGTTLITIKKATTTNYTDVSETGWVSTMGDGQAIFAEGTTFNTAYWVWDGVTGSGSDYSTYGFKIAPSTCLSKSYLMGVPNIGYSSATVTNVTISHTAFVGCGFNADYIYTDGCEEGTTCYYYQIGVYSSTAYANRADSITISNNYFSGAPSNILLGWNNGSIEGNWFNDNWCCEIVAPDTNCDPHCQQISSLSTALGENLTGNTIKNNTFKDSTVFVLGSHGMGATDIFGNLIIGGAMSTGVFANANSSTTDEAQDWKVYNNTMDAQGGTCGSKGFVFVGNLTTTDDAALVKNNLIYNATSCVMNNSTAADENVVHDYNAYIDVTSYTDETNKQTATGDLFVNSAGGDYRLSAATTAGLDSIGSTYSVDPNGFTRGLDGVWDRGAYEFDAAPANPTYAINAAGSSFTVTFSEAVTHGAGGTTGWVLTSDGGAVTATYSSGAGSTVLVYQLSRTVYSTETITGTYTQPTNGIEDTAGNDFASVTDVAITNNSTATAGAPTYPKMTLSTGSNVTLSPSGTGSFTLAP